MCALLFPSSFSLKNVMLRRQFIPILFNRIPCILLADKNFSVACVRHVSDKNTRKRNGLFRKLKGVFSKAPDYKNNEYKHTIVKFIKCVILDLSKKPLERLNKMIESPENVRSVSADTNISEIKINHYQKNQQITRSQLNTNLRIKHITNFNESFTSMALDPLIESHERKGFIPLIKGLTKCRNTFCIHCIISENCYGIPVFAKLCEGNDLTSVNKRLITRFIAGFAPTNSKPPVREPNMPENTGRKEEKREKKKDKKPVICTDGIPGKCGVATVIRKAEVTPEPPHRYEWGVKLQFPLEQSENTEESSSRRTRNQVVNVNQNKKDLKSTGNTVANVVNAVKINLSTDPTKSSNVQKSETPKIATSPTGGTKSGTVVGLNKTNLNRSDVKKQEKTNSVPVRTKNTASPVIEKPQNAGTVSGMTKQTLTPLQDTVIIDGDYNVPLDMTAEKQVLAWANVIENSSPPVPPRGEDWSDEMDNLELQMMTIPPEPPNPKIDVQVVKSVNDYNAEEDVYGTANVSSVDKKTRRSTKQCFTRDHIPIDSYVFKKFHTDSKCNGCCECKNDFNVQEK